MNKIRRIASPLFKLLVGLGLLGLIWAGAPLAVAQDAPPPAGGRLDGPASQPAGPAAGQAVLYAQMNAPGTEWVASQDFANDSYDSLGADDFFASSSETIWWIQTVEVVGGYRLSATTVDAVAVQFYADAGSAPGALLQARTVPAAQIGGLASGSFTLPLNPSVSLPTNVKYWVSVQAITAALQWVWVEQTAQAGSAAVWRNPGGGLQPGCANWTIISNCIPNTGPDLTFRLSGTAFSPQYKIFTPIILR